MKHILGLKIEATFSLNSSMTFAQQYGWFAQSSGITNNLNSRLTGSPNGVYYFTITAGSYTDTERLVLIK